MRLLILLCFMLVGEFATAQEMKCRKLPLQSGDYDFTEYINLLARPVPECDRTAHMEIPCLKRDVRQRLREALNDLNMPADSGRQYYIYEYTVHADGTVDRIFFYNEEGPTEVGSIQDFLTDMTPLQRKVLSGDPATHTLASFGVTDYLIIENGVLIVPGDGGL